MGNLKSGNTSAPKPTKETAVKAETFKFKFDWRYFFIYGAMWCLVFVAIVFCHKVCYTIYDQHRQIQDLINRIHQYEDPDFSDRDKIPPYGDDESDNTTLSSWVKQNLPKDGIDERPAVAEVFENLADMLDDGTLKGEKDAFSEGISQLQPVATRRIWLPFLTKLTKKLQKQNLDNEKLSSAFRIIAKAINPQKNRAVLLLESIAPNPPANEQKTEADQVIGEEGNPSQNEPQGDQEAETEDKPQTTQQTGDCEGGNCPSSGYYWRYF